MSAGSRIAVRVIVDVAARDRDVGFGHARLRGEPHRRLDPDVPARRDRPVDHPPALRHARRIMGTLGHLRHQDPFNELEVIALRENLSLDQVLIPFDSEPEGSPPGSRERETRWIRHHRAHARDSLVHAVTRDSWSRRSRNSSTPRSPGPRRENTCHLRSGRRHARPSRPDVVQPLIRVGGGRAWLDRAHRGRFGTRLRVPR